MPEHLKPLEIEEASSLLELARVLGLVETPKMSKLRGGVVSALKEGKSCIEQYRKYEEEAEALKERIGEAVERRGRIFLVLRAIKALTSSIFMRANAETQKENPKYFSERKIDLALLIMKALMLRDGGADINVFKEEIADAVTYAEGLSNSYPENYKSIESHIKALMSFN